MQLKDQKFNIQIIQIFKPL